MRNTLVHVMNNWDWKDTWGWDYPLIAMSAVRLNEPELAIAALLMDVPKIHIYLMVIIFKPQVFLYIYRVMEDC